MVQRLDWSELPEPSGTFEARPFYDPDGDSITLFLRPDESYRERVDRYLTVYRSIATNQVIGCQVKDVKKVLATVKTFKLGIETRSLTLGLLLLSVPWASAEGSEEGATVHWRHYREIVRPILEDAGFAPLPVPELVG